MTTQLREYRVGPRTAALGLRLWDPVAGALVGDGLVVSAFPTAAPLRVLSARVNASCVHVFHHLPGMAAVERGAGDQAFWDDVPVSAPFVLTVDDALGRFVPIQLAVQVPVRDALVFALPASFDVLGVPVGAVPMFSSATRAVPAGFGVFRAELWDPAATTLPAAMEPGAPAAFAAITAQVGPDAVVRGIADARGRVALLFPFPAPIGAGSDGLTSVPLTKQTWPVTLRVRYARAPTSPLRAELPATVTRAEAALWQRWSETAAQRVALGSLELAYGKELVARSEGPSGRLYVTSP